MNLTDMRVLSLSEALERAIVIGRLVRVLEWLSLREFAKLRFAADGANSFSAGANKPG